LTQLPQIPHFIASTKPLWDHMINVHCAFNLPTLLATAIALENHFSDLTPPPCAAAFP
jgi:hypothetical protein